MTTPKPSGNDWGVRVNEAGIFATRLGAAWWTTAFGPWETSGRALCLGLCPAGGVWWLPAGTREDAQWMKGHITGHGVPGRFVTVKRRSAAVAERAKRRLP